MCVKEEDALVMFTVIALDPVISADAVTLLMVDALAILLKVPDPDAVTFP